MRQRIVQTRRELAQLSPFTRKLVYFAFMAPSLLWMPMIWWLFSELVFHDELLQWTRAARDEGVSLEIVAGVISASYERTPAHLVLVSSIFVLGLFGSFWACIFPAARKRSRAKTDADPLNAMP